MTVSMHLETEIFFCLLHKAELGLEIYVAFTSATLSEGGHTVATSRYGRPPGLVGDVFRECHRFDCFHRLKQLFRLTRCVGSPGGGKHVSALLGCL